jgi:predicted butyrate kinase (DUF1464 family)
MNNDAKSDFDRRKAREAAKALEAEKEAALNGLIEALPRLSIELALADLASGRTDRVPKLFGSVSDIENALRSVIARLGEAMEEVKMDNREDDDFTALFDFTSEQYAKLISIVNDKGAQSIP